MGIDADYGLSHQGISNASHHIMHMRVLLAPLRDVRPLNFLRTEEQFRRVMTPGMVSFRLFSDTHWFTMTYAVVLELVGRPTTSPAIRFDACPSLKFLIDHLALYFNIIATLRSRSISATEPPREHYDTDASQVGLGRRETSYCTSLYQSGAW